MFDWLSKTILVVVLTAAGAGLVAAPMLFGPTIGGAAAISSAVIGAVFMLAAVGFGYGSLDFWSRFALGAGTWTLVAPILFGFHEGGPSFWSHMLAGFLALVVGIGGHELMARRHSPTASD